MLVHFSEWLPLLCSWLRGQRPFLTAKAQELRTGLSSLQIVRFWSLLQVRSGQCCPFRLRWRAAHSAHSPVHSHPGMWVTGSRVSGQTLFSGLGLLDRRWQLPAAPVFLFLPKSLGLFVFFVISVVFFQNGTSDRLRRGD